MPTVILAVRCDWSEIFRRKNDYFFYDGRGDESRPSYFGVSMERKRCGYMHGEGAV